MSQEKECPNCGRSDVCEEVERLQELCACAYQYIGAEGGEVRFLDALSAAASGRPFNTEHLLPYVPPEPNEQCNRETLRERELRAENTRLKAMLASRATRTPPQEGQ